MARLQLFFEEKNFYFFINQNRKKLKAQRNRTLNRWRMKVSPLHTKFDNKQIQIYQIKIDIMRSSQMKEEKIKELRTSRKKGKNMEAHKWLKGHKSQKKVHKYTPKNSHEKGMKQRNNSKNQKQETGKSEYFTKSHEPQAGYLGQQCSDHDNLMNAKKKNRRSKQKIHRNNANKKNGQFNEYMEDKDLQPTKCLKSPILKKIKMLSSQGDIGYKGDNINNNENSMISNRSGQQRKGIKSRKKKKHQSKEKEKKGKKDKIKRTKTLKDTKINQNINENYNFPSQNQFRPEIINIHQVQRQIQQENNNTFEFILSNQMIKERAQCFNMIGKICSSMNLKRQVFAMALSYIDTYIDSQTQPQALKPISITALMMALKIDHAEKIGGFPMSSLSMAHSMTSTKALSISTEVKQVDKKRKTEQNRQKFNLNRPKFPNILTRVLSHEQIYSQYNRVPCKDQIMDMQMQMMVKLNFNLNIKTFSNWIDILTILWDKYLIQHSAKSKYLFRSMENVKNFSYLCQLVQIAYYFPYAYFYSKCVIILSIMYLIVRIRAQFPLEKEDKGFQTFQTNLLKSNNIIFVDKACINELFGRFLGFLKLDLGDIVNCCQYVSNSFNYKILRVSPFQFTKSMTLDQYLSTYHYNPQFFRFFQSKYEREEHET